MQEKAERQNKTYKVMTVLSIIGLMLLLCMEFILHRHVPFMMDDLWYGTNLATGEKLSSFTDVIESQIWHYRNWGGRSITHGILQLTLMSGEWAADILNLAMTMLLGIMVCVVARQKKMVWLFAASVMGITLNANTKMSMFWQAGTVNYVYSTVWLLLFLWVYLRETDEQEAKRLPGVNLWMLPLGLMTGWSNENMGPACALIAFAVVVYHVKFKKGKMKFWMPAGVMTSFIGSVMMILAPGNFVRDAAIEKKGLWESIGERITGMLCATGEYLFPVLLLLAVAFLLRMCCVKEPLKPFQWGLFAVVILAHGAMILSPHYPDRATFGTMITAITLMISFLGEITEQRRDILPYIMTGMGCMWIYALYDLWSCLHITG